MGTSPDESTRITIELSRALLSADPTISNSAVAAGVERVLGQTAKGSTALEGQLGSSAKERLSTIVAGRFLRPSLRAAGLTKEETQQALQRSAAVWASASNDASFTKTVETSWQAMEQAVPAKASALASMRQSLTGELQTLRENPASLYQGKVLDFRYALTNGGSTPLTLKLPVNLTGTQSQQVIVQPQSQMPLAVSVQINAASGQGGVIALDVKPADDGTFQLQASGPGEIVGVAQRGDVTSAPAKYRREVQI
jgi:hypothetical protein